MDEFNVVDFLCGGLRGELEKYARTVDFHDMNNIRMIINDTIEINLSQGKVFGELKVDVILIR